MADYKLSELNSIDTIRSDDLLHVRVKKRPEMLGDEDRRMTYQDFLASFNLERFVQIAGSTMTGDLGIVKLLYGGKAVFDPTGSSEINIGDVLKTFKINSNGLRLTIADASRSATVYHTLNKPSPNELGMRTNEENDARYARLAVTNSFQAKQSVVANGEQLTLKTPAGASEAYSAIVGRNANNDKTWAVGNLTQGSLDVHLENSRGSRITLGAIVSVNKALAITGQVQPSDFSNLDARYFTQAVANQRFAQLAANNTFSGANTFTNSVSVNSDAAAIILKNKTVNDNLFILARDSENNNLWYIGKGDTNSNVTLYDYKGGTSIKLDSSGVTFNKVVKIIGQVQPSDWANIDSRYIPAATLNNLAKINVSNTFTNTQTIVANNEGLIVKNLTQNQPLYIRGVDTTNTSRWWIGVGGNNSNVVTWSNSYSGTAIALEQSVIVANKSLAIAGQVQPSDFSNLDARYYTQSVANSRYMLASLTGSASEKDGGNGVAWNARTGLYNVTNTTGGASFLVSHMFLGAGSTPSAQLKFEYRNGGMWYRTSRDAYGFEVNWSKVYTEAQKPTPSDIGAYTKAETDQKIAQAVSDSTDLNKIYPVGIVTWFNSNVNPNTALPGLTWTYLNNGVGRTIRIAAANGSDVATTGGSDSVTLAVGNLPSHTHSFSATTSSFDYGTKGTNSTGGHTHSGSGSTSTNGEHSHYIEAWNGTGAGGSKMSSYAVAYRAGGSNTNAAGNHSHTFSFSTNNTGAHTHSVGIGAHSHTVSGNTGGTGSGSAFSVTNQFYKLMAWVRTA
ncbi:tail fiber protein [Escherichia phage vB_EcoM_AYO145A]|uniref:Tail fiber protein n=1 Tax=Escherichia phage vB_EcoM_AYO145A TaxID=1636202 RepID=A0A0E3TAY1_9CAUD|nr:tail fiber protein [Escherichia phage vB_EcoM_AYO145A]AKC04906.1 tail fiber protein [Escherichia phage vB_EcoM_AYO145A]